VDTRRLMAQQSSVGSTDYGSLFEHSQAGPSVLHTLWASDRAGAELLCLRLCATLRACGWRVLTVAVGGAGPVADIAAEAQVPWFCIPEGSSIVYRLRVLNQIVDRFRPDLFHTHFLGDDPYVRLMAARSRVPVVGTFHGTSPKEPWHRRLQKTTAAAEIGRAHV
jgi:hypothetical protein